jgi:hypothetical protein
MSRNELKDADDVSADEAEADLGVNELPGLSEYRKAIVSAVAVVVAILATQGIEVDTEIVAAVTTLLTAFLVWRVPNADPPAVD